LKEDKKFKKRVPARAYQDLKKKMEQDLTIFINLNLHGLRWLIFS
jgi:hypothetical protein